MFLLIQACYLLIGITDYELEFEVNDEEAGLKQFKELCEIYHLQYKGNCASKIVRVLSNRVDKE